MHFNAHDKDSVETFARTVLTLPEPYDHSIAAGILALGLMKAPLTLRIPIWLRSLVGTEPFVIYTAVLHKYPLLVSSILAQTYEWAINGHDRDDPLSAGGFSQREIDMITGMLELAEEHKQEVAAEAGE
jgi:hypothetical protein